MNAEQFWQKANDIHRLYLGQYRYDIRTDEELKATVTDYIRDTMALIGEWYNSQENGNKENKSNDVQLC